MTPENVKENIIRWVSTCTTSDHFDGIQLAVNNCLLPLKAKHSVDSVDDAERDVLSAISQRKSIIGLAERRPSDDEVTDEDSALEGTYNHKNLIN